MTRKGWWQSWLSLYFPTVSEVTPIWASLNEYKHCPWEMKRDLGSEGYQRSGHPALWQSNMIIWSLREGPISFSGCILWEMEKGSANPKEIYHQICDVLHWNWTTHQEEDVQRRLRAALPRPEGDVAHRPSPALSAPPKLMLKLPPRFTSIIINDEMDRERERYLFFPAMDYILQTSGNALQKCNLVMM